MFTIGLSTDAEYRSLSLLTYQLLRAVSMYWKKHMTIATQEARAQTWMILVTTASSVYLWIEHYHFIGFFSVQVLDKALKVWGLK